jgi:hypothetical protein
MMTTSIANVDANYAQVKATLDKLIEGLELYKNDVWRRFMESKKPDELTRKKHDLARDLWCNLKEIRHDMTEADTDNTLTAIKFLYANAHTEHEKILNDILSYYLLGALFKQMGYLWGGLGKHLDASTIELNKPKTNLILHDNNDEKSTIKEDKLTKAQAILDDLIQGLFLYKENTGLKLKQANTDDLLTQQKYKLSDELWLKLTTLRHQLTSDNTNETFELIKQHYSEAHSNHEKILNDIISTSCVKHLPYSVSGFLNNYLSTFFNYLGSLWLGKLGKELNKGKESIPKRPSPN